jgi:hypothetical protein
MRRAGVLPYQWLADNTRWMRKPRTYTSLFDLLATTARTYRRSLWTDSEDYVEVWLEKDALAGVLYQVTEAWDVPLMVTRGYPSLSYLHEAAAAIRACGKPTYLYYFGDYDPSGVDIPRKVEADICEMAPEIDVTLSRVAVNEWQIAEWQLPTRPTKTTDSRAKAFGQASVEVDAVAARQLRALVQQCIARHVNTEALAVLEAAEASEREVLGRLAEKVAQGELQ